MTPSPSPMLRRVCGSPQITPSLSLTGLFVAGLEHSAHVLEKSGKVFSATLGLVDIVKGTNSYYKLQLLESDKESRCVQRGRDSRSYGAEGTGLCRVQPPLDSS